MVDEIASHELMSIIYAYSDYNQISMHKDDAEKTSFIIDKGTYCSKVMPLDLKNEGTTF